MLSQISAFDILRLLETPGFGFVKVNRIIDYLYNENLQLNDIIGDSGIQYKVFNESQLKVISSNEKRVLEIWDRLKDGNVSILTSHDDDYPNLLRKRLGEKAPPFLTVLGNKNILKKISVGFCGSRKASDKGIETAYDCAIQIANKNYNIVSGYAAGIDMRTHSAALEVGGTTTIVLAEGILNFKVKRGVKDLFDLDKIAVISEILPGITWNVRNAMLRNQTICALSHAMILIESGINGGSMAAGKTCLEFGIPLFAPIYEGMPSSAIGNRELLKHGARPLLKSRTTNMANLTNVFEIINQNKERTMHNEKQHAKLW
jgi:predicted Rossmann fold nucleotide-binding protein DprA/Smf involved in DNA uptake